MIISVPKESAEGEKRVALTPDAARRLVKLGHTLRMERGAGIAAEFSDADYEGAGVEVVDGDAVWRDTDVIMKVRKPDRDEADRIAGGTTLISFFWPAQDQDLLRRMAERRVNVLAMDCIPRLSRAQKMDALSSMANIGGYRAVLEAAHQFSRFFTGQITAAGKVPPAKILVIGAGVAGLAAIGAAKSMGAVVRAFDTRLEVKEQIESLGGEFLELDFGDESGSGEGGYAKTMSDEFIAAEMALFAEQAKEVDIIITTALIPGKPAPELITAGMVESMKSGSVIVDMAAEQGGNCELTRMDQVVDHGGVRIIGYTDLPSRLATQSSQLYSTNLYHLVADLTPEKDGVIRIDMEDDVIRGATAALDGKVTWPPPAPELSAAPRKPAVPPPGVREPVELSRSAKLKMTVGAMLVGLIALLGLGSVAPPDFMAHFTVFVLACFVGYQVIWSVTPALHTPLMSVTNAISGIIVVGALLQISSPSWMMKGLAFVAVLIASINIAGGFLVTRRMLKMFRK